MKNVISAKTLRTELAAVLRRVSKGERITVLYRSRPACQIVPVDSVISDKTPLDDDPLYQAGPVGASTDGKSAADHDELLYGDYRE